MRDRVTKALAVAFCVIGGMAVAGDYTWSGGAVTPNDGKIAITAPEGQVTAITATPEAGETLRLTGEALNFAADATVTMASSGTLTIATAVTTAGKLGIGRSDGAYLTWTGSIESGHEYLPNKTENAWEVFTYEDLLEGGSTELADWEPVSARLKAHKPSAAFLDKGMFSGVLRPGYVSEKVTMSGGDNNLYSSLNMFDGQYTYGARVQMAQTPNTQMGIKVRMIAGSKARLYEDVSATGDIINLPQKTGCVWFASDFDDYGIKGLGLDNLTIRRRGAGAAVVRFEGQTTLGGETDVDVGTVAVLPVGRGMNEEFTMSLGGEGEFRFEPVDANFGSRGTTEYYDGFLQKGSTWVAIATNRQLSALTGMTARMQGASHNSSDPDGGTLGEVYHLAISPDGKTGTGQFQIMWGDNIKVVLFKLRQNGLNVEAVGDVSGYRPKKDMPLGSDFSKAGLSDAVATSATASKYGMHKITCTFDENLEMPMLCLNDTNVMRGASELTFAGTPEMPLIVDVPSGMAFPSGSVVRVTHADVYLSCTSFNINTGYSGGETRLWVGEGGILRQCATANAGNGTIGNTQVVELDGGELNCMGGSAENAAFYLNKLILRNGGRVTGNSPRAVHSNPQWWNVQGETPSYIDSGITVYGGQTADITRTFCIHVEDVTKDAETDCEMLRFICAAGYDYFSVIKTGAGTLRTTGDSRKALKKVPVEVQGGTFAVGGANSMTNAFKLTGGSLAVEANNSFDTLTVTTEATISVADGVTLAFADSSAMAWKARNRAVVIDGDLTKSRVRFGTDANGLTAAQQRMLRTADGQGLCLDADGYLMPRGFLMLLR